MSRSGFWVLDLLFWGWVYASPAVDGPEIVMVFLG